METHLTLRHLVEIHGRELLTDPAHLRGVLDDYFDESSTPIGEINLLVDAVRLGAVDGLIRMVEGGAQPDRALDAVALRLARDRGGADLTAARWACAMLGFAMGLIPEALVLGLRSVEAPAAVTEPARGPHSAETMAAGPRSEVATATPTPESARRSVRGFVAAGIVALVVGGAVGTFALAGVGDDDKARDAGSVATEPGTSPSTSSRSARPEPRAARTSPATPRSEHHAPATMAATPPTTYRCWDGSTTARLGECGPPTGLVGAHWVFPQSASQDCVSESPAGRAVHLECTVFTSSGGFAYVKYSQWRSWANASAHYSGDPGIESHDPDWNGLLLWYVRDDGEPCCSFKAAVLYPYAPWSATIYAASPGERAELLDALQFHPPGALAGTPE